MQYVGHNISVLPCNSPRFAHEIVRESRRIDNWRGFAYYVGGAALASPNYDLMGKALAYYSEHDEPYSDEPWRAILEERFGAAAAAQHFLNAYNTSGRITPAVNRIAWSPHDGRCPNQLILKYWHWTEEDIKFSHFASLAQGATLLPVRYYAEVVARYGNAFRDNNGSDFSRAARQAAGPVRHGHPGAQELMWGHVDYQVTPEMHMRAIRKMGRECLAEAQLAMKTVKKNQQMAKSLYNFMKAYDLLSAYYERKVLTAIAALIYSFGGPETEKTRAERLADQTTLLYTKAASFMYEAIDGASGNMKGGWWDETRDLPGLIEVEKRDQKDLAKLFRWSKRPAAPAIDAKRKGKPAATPATGRQ